MTQAFPGLVLARRRALGLDDDDHDLRLTYVGASESAAVLGLGGGYAGPHEVWLSKRGEYVPELEDVMLHGQLAEVPVLTLARREAGLDWFESLETYRHRKHRMLGCNPDAGATRDGKLCNVQVKLMGSWARRDLDALAETGRAPSGSSVEGYVLQTQHERICTESDAAVLVVLCADRVFVADNDVVTHNGQLYVIDIVNDDAMADLIETEIPAFWRYHVEGGVPPEVTRADVRAVNAAFRKGELNSATMTAHDLYDEADEAMRLSRELKDARAAVRRLEADRAHCEARIKGRMRWAERCEIGPFVATWRRRGDTRVFKLTRGR